MRLLNGDLRMALTSGALVLILTCLGWQACTPETTQAVARGMAEGAAVAAPVSTAVGGPLMGGIIGLVAIVSGAIAAYCAMRIRAGRRRKRGG